MVRPFRVMWFSNNTSAREFELQMLKRAGVDEIFIAKSHPQEAVLFSASISGVNDKSLTISERDLALLNAQNWYGKPSKAAWAVANAHFDALFFIFCSSENIRSIADNFTGAVLWRAYGLIQGNSYSRLLTELAPNNGVERVRHMGRRFWFAQAYPNLHKYETELIASRRLDLPLGLIHTMPSQDWRGGDKRILFVCPDVETNPYYKKKSVHDWFAEHLGNLPYIIDNSQSNKLEHSSVLGSLPCEQRLQNMKELRLMFYHSSEHVHIHSQPFEAVRAGMPLVFMAGGMLDVIGGYDLPGRCKTLAEAKAKIKRILNDDWSLIDGIRQSQSVLLKAVQPDLCQKAWARGIKQIRSELAVSRQEQTHRSSKARRIAVLVPVGYRGGSLRGAKLLAEALYQGSRQWDESAEVVFAHLDDAITYPEKEFSDLNSAIRRRVFQWKTLSASEARRAMRYAGHEYWEPSLACYGVPDDGIQQFQDCDLLVIVSDRLNVPMLPTLPCIHMVYDYLQRYMTSAGAMADQTCLDAVRQADHILVTTEFTRQDALQYAGVPTAKVSKVPMLAPEFPSPELIHLGDSKNLYQYFIWTTNLALHKNHENAFQALKIYYEQLDGTLNCLITGVGTATLLKSQKSHLAKAVAIFQGCNALEKRLTFAGELTETDYQQRLAAAAFLWHAAAIDNGTFSVIEAASLGVPALSSDYPAMREIDAQFSLALAWMDPSRPEVMAEKLKLMEMTFTDRRILLPTSERLADQRVEKLAGDYWKVVREWL